MNNFRCGRCGNSWEDYSDSSICPMCGGIGEQEDDSSELTRHSVITASANLTSKKKNHYSVSSPILISLFRNKKIKRRK